jgi:hypothetical protein
VEDSSDPQWRAALYLETAANLLRLLKRVWAISSKRALELLNNQTDFDSAIRRFDASRPSHALAFLENFLPLIRKARQMRAFLIANGLRRPMIELFGSKIPKSLQPTLRKLPFSGDAPWRPKNKSTAC